MGQLWASRRTEAAASRGQGARRAFYWGSLYANDRKWTNMDCGQSEGEDDEIDRKSNKRLSNVLGGSHFKLGEKWLITQRTTRSEDTGEGLGF